MTFATPAMQHWLEREIAQCSTMKDRSDDPSRHERTLSPRSYHLAPDLHHCTEAVCLLVLIIKSPIVLLQYCADVCCIRYRFYSRPRLHAVVRISRPITISPSYSRTMGRVTYDHTQQFIDSTIPQTLITTCPGGFGVGWGVASLKNEELSHAPCGELSLIPAAISRHA